MKIDMKKTVKYFPVESWDILAPGEHDPCCHDDLPIKTNDLEESLKAAEMYCKDTGREVYIAQLIRVVTPKIREVETTVVK